MTNPIIVKDEGGDFELKPVGNHPAVCCGVYDIGTHRKEYQGKEKLIHQGVIIWEFGLKRNDGEPFTISRFYTLSLDPRSNLRRDLISWRGKPFTDEELKGFDISVLPGAPCLINVTHDEWQGKPKANISSISSLPKEMQRVTRTIMEEPEWIGKMRARSTEAQEDPNYQDVPPPTDEQGEVLPF